MLFPVGPEDRPGLCAQAHQAQDGTDGGDRVREPHAPGGVRAVRGGTGVRPSTDRGGERQGGPDEDRRDAKGR